MLRKKVLREIKNNAKGARSNGVAKAGEYNVFKSSDSDRARIAGAMLQKGVAADGISKELGNDGRPGRAVRNMVTKVRRGGELTEKRPTGGRGEDGGLEIAARIRAEMKRGWANYQRQRVRARPRAWCRPEAKLGYYQQFAQPQVCGHARKVPGATSEFPRPPRL